MNDSELLEAAAQVAGIDLMPTGYVWRDDIAEMVPWNPLINDGDALRLAVALHFEVDATGDRVGAGDGLLGHYEPCNGDRFAATRRAIVIAAAALSNGGQS